MMFRYLHFNGTVRYSECSSSVKNITQQVFAIKIRFLDDGIAMVKIPETAVAATVLV